MTLPDPLFERAVARFLEQGRSCTRLRVAYSGGADSLAALLIAADWGRGSDIPVDAIHVCHGMHADATSWADHCAATCQSLGIPLIVLDVGGEHPPRNETEARDRRYAAFAAQLEVGDVLIVAHHRQDQIETALLQLIRGCGLEGLAGMPQSRPLGAGFVLRPLLDADRESLRERSAASGLSWIEDPSNQCTEPDRNALRHEILPLLAQRWPSVRDTLGRSIDLVNQARLALAEVLERDLAAVANLAQLDLDAWEALPQSRQSLVLRAWIKREGLATPDHRQLDELLRQAGDARDDASPLVTWPGVEVRRYRRALYAGPPLDHPDPGIELPFDQAEVALPAGLGCLCWQFRQEPPEHLPALSVRFRTGGESLSPAGRRMTRPLKLLFQEAGIPPWERGRIPLVYRDQELLAVVDLAASAALRELESRLDATLVWRRG